MGRRHATPDAHEALVARLQAVGFLRVDGPPGFNEDERLRHRTLNAHRNDGAIWVRIVRGVEQIRATGKRAGAHEQTLRGLLEPDGTDRRLANPVAVWHGERATALVARLATWNAER